MTIIAARNTSVSGLLSLSADGDNLIAPFERSSSICKSYSECVVHSNLKFTLGLYVE